MALQLQTSENEWITVLIWQCPGCRKQSSLGQRLDRLGSSGFTVFHLPRPGKCRKDQAIYAPPKMFCVALHPRILEQRTYRAQNFRQTYADSSYYITTPKLNEYTKEIRKGCHIQCSELCGESAVPWKSKEE